MREKPQNGRCVHCLKFTDDITNDHVFPDSWYPETTPVSVQRWTVPCCRLCNEKFGALESDLLARLALCLDPATDAAKGLSKKALRSLGIDAGELSPREREHRENRRRKLVAEFITIGADEQLAGAIPGIAKEMHLAGSVVPIPWAALAIIGEKIARGCEYKENGKRFVEPPYGIRVRVSQPNVVESQFLSRKKVIDFGPGCQVFRIFATEDVHVVQYRIQIWGELCLYVHLDYEDYLQSEFDSKKKPLDGLSPSDYKGMRIPPYLREFQ